MDIMLSHLLTIYLGVDFQTVFQSGCTILYSYQQYQRVPTFYIPSKTCYFVSFFILAILVYKVLYLMVLICTS